MVTTFRIKPAPILQPFVNCYALRIFNAGSMMPQPMHAVHESYLTFFLSDQFVEVRAHSGESTGSYSSSLVSLLTESLGCSYYTGHMILFCVQYKPNGIFGVFGIPQKILINTILSIEEILGRDAKPLSEKLALSADINEMGTHMDSYLTSMLAKRKHKYYTHTISGISNIILRNKGLVSLDKLAYHANMSFRNFERRFVDEVGMPPKLYARVTRFYNALENKMLHPEKKWADIIFENGFFDQAHFIKEVKAFSSKTPDELFKFTPPPKENFIGKVEY